MKKVLFISIGLFVLAGCGFIYSRSQKQATAPPPDAAPSDSSSSESDANFQSVQDNLNIKTDASNIVVVNFNSGLNYAQFYNNDRFIIFNKTAQIVLKGNYSNGGKTLTGDSTYGYKVANGSSVYTNLLTILNK